MAEKYFGCAVIEGRQGAILVEKISSPKRGGGGVRLKRYWAYNRIKKELKR